MKDQIKNKKGFTLVEVIAVLVILGILAAVAIPKFFDMQDNARIKGLASCIAVLNGEAKLWINSRFIQFFGFLYGDS